MARFFLSITVALATAAAILGSSSSVSAQPAVSTSAGPAAPSTAPKEEYPEVREGLSYLQQRDLPKAVETLHKASLKYSKLPTEYVLLYQFFALPQVNQRNAALEMLYTNVYKYPSDPESWVIMGNIALSDRRLPEAEIDFAKANQLLEKYSNEDRKPALQQMALSGMVEVAERRELWAQAESRLRELLKASPKDIVAMQRLARAEFQQSKAEDAWADLKKAKQIDLDNVAKDATHKAREQMLPAAAIIAQYYDSSDRRSKPAVKSENAKKWFTYALTQAPDDLNLRAVVTVWALDNGEMQLAKEQAKEALRIENEDAKLPRDRRKWPDTAAGRMLSGYVAIWDKKYPEAQDFFEKVLLENPNDFTVKNNLALALIEQDDAQKKDRALQYAYGNYQANKENIEAASTLSWVYYKLEKYDLAGTVMDAVLRATNGNVNNPDTATYLAHILYHNDNGKNGLKLQAKKILKTFLDTGRYFSMRPEALKLYELVKDEKEPEAAAPATPKLP